MLYPLQETVASVEPFVSDAVVPRSAIDAVRPIVRRLPDATSHHYFECRLGCDAHRVDFLTCATASDGGRDILAAAPLLGSSGEAWARVRAFCARWADPTTVLHGGVPLIWIEFDIDARASQPPDPSLHFCVHSDLRRVGRSLGERNERSHEQLWTDGLSTLLPESRLDSSDAFLRRCRDALSGHGRLDHVSVMLGRRPAALKLTATIPSNQLPDFLTRVGWPGRVEEIRALFETLSLSGGIIQFDLDFATGLPPSIGIGLFDDPPDPSRRDLLDRLVESSMCTRAKRDALARWPGLDDHVFRGHRWPARIHRRLDLKLVLRAGQPASAKGYLGFAAIFSIV